MLTAKAGAAAGGHRARAISSDVTSPGMSSGLHQAKVLVLASNAAVERSTRRSSPGAVGVQASSGTLQQSCRFTLMVAWTWSSGASLTVYHVPDDKGTEWAALEAAPT